MAPGKSSASRLVEWTLSIYLSAMPDVRRYPDLKELFARKANGRTERAKATVVEKLDALDRLRTLTAPIVSAKQSRANKIKR